MATYFKTSKASYNTVYKRMAGFTLLEIMIAVAILATALGAAIKTTSSSLNNAAYLQQRTLAHWVAMNTYNELEVFEKWPAPGGKSSGTMLMAGHEWHWKVETNKSDEVGQYSIGAFTITVSADENDKQFLASIEGGYEF